MENRSRTPVSEIFRSTPWEWFVLNTVATDPLALEHQAISIHSADKISIVLNQFH